MKHVDEYRAGSYAQALAKGIQLLAGRIGRPLKFMEVCGGHTHTIFKYGLHQLLPSNVDLVHGPGCPVCVLPLGRMDDAIALAASPNVIFTTFGDAMRVPGSKHSLLDARAAGADVRMVYSPLDAVRIAVENPDKEVVFFAIGFETTAPSTAIAVLQARREGIRNFSVFCNHVLVIPALKSLLDSPGFSLDGFIGPGHVSTIIGTWPYDFIARQYKVPLVVAGFEPADVMLAVYMLVRQVYDGRADVENQYRRVVCAEGSRRALECMNEVYEVRDSFEWRGLGSIPASGLQVRPQFAAFDAERKFAIAGNFAADPKACQCGEVLKGARKPWECKVFGKACTPRTPIGACMVSSEGACAASYNYGRGMAYSASSAR